MNKINFLPPWVETNLQPAFYDVESGTVLQQVARMYAKVNQLVRNVNDQNIKIEEYVQKFIELKDYVDTYFDNLDVQEEINNKLDAMAEDGTFDTIIARYILIAPSGTEYNFKRIGRKLFRGDLVNPVGFGMQGGVMIDENTVAYALWDNYNQDTNKNRLVVMNINTGEIYRSADYTWGWCNSIAYHDGKLYVAVRGTTSGGVGTNNGTIKVVDAGTLALLDTIDMSFNVNAIYHTEDGFYLLQESSGNVFLYDDTLTTQKQTIILDDSNYHQNICVDEHFIYLLSSRPASSIKIYDLDGQLVRAINIKKYNGRYATGEVQWIDKRGDDLILGSVNNNFITGIAQFFYTNLATNVEVNEYLNIAALTVYCDSEADYYDADGSSAKPFTEIQECAFIDIPNMVINGNNKSYHYVYMSDRQYVRIESATLSEGAYLQYGTYVLNAIEVDYSTNPSVEGCLYIRNNTVYLNGVTLDGGNNANLIVNGGYNKIHFNTMTFQNYTGRIFDGTNISSDITIDSTDNVPYIPRLYDVAYNLCCNQNLGANAVDTYTWQTNLSQAQVKDLIDNCTHIIVGVKTLNGSNIIEHEMPIREDYSSTYNIDQITSSSSSVNVRIAKSTFRIYPQYFEITLRANTLITADGSSNPTATTSNTNVFEYVKVVRRH